MPPTIKSIAIRSYVAVKEAFTLACRVLKKAMEARVKPSISMIITKTAIILRWRLSMKIPPINFS